MFVPTTKALVDQRQAPAPWTPQRRAASTGIRLSEAGSCPRLQTLRLLKAPSDPYVQSAAMNAGISWEDYVALVWRDAYPDTQRKVPVSSPFGAGEADLWIPSLRKLVEVKSTNAERAQWLPDQQHVAQLTLYMGYWPGADANDQGEPGINGELAYVVRETGQVLSITVDWDQNLFDDLVHVLDLIALAKRDGTALPIPSGYQWDRFPCRWRVGDPGEGRCRYYTNCWGVQGDGQGVQALDARVDYVTLNR